MLLESKHKIAFQKSLGQVVRDTFSLFYWVSHDLEACFQSSTKSERNKFPDNKQQIFEVVKSKSFPR